MEKLFGQSNQPNHLPTQTAKQEENEKGKRTWQNNCQLGLTPNIFILPNIKTARLHVTNSNLCLVRWRTIVHCRPTLQRALNCIVLINQTKNTRPRSTILNQVRVGSRSDRQPWLQVTAQPKNATTRLSVPPSSEVLGTSVEPRLCTTHKSQNKT